MPTNIYRVVEAGAGAGELEGIRGALRGRRVLVTGVTGFLGQALLERLLHDVPDIRPVVLIRSRGGQTPRSRLEELFEGRPTAYSPERSPLRRAAGIGGQGSAAGGAG